MSSAGISILLFPFGGSLDHACVCACMCIALKGLIALLKYPSRCSQEPATVESKKTGHVHSGGILPAGRPVAKQLHCVPCKEIVQTGFRVRSRIWLHGVTQSERDSFLLRLADAARQHTAAVYVFGSLRRIRDPRPRRMLSFGWRELGFSFAVESFLQISYIFG